MDTLCHWRQRCLTLTYKRTNIFFTVRAVKMKIGVPGEMVLVGFIDNMKRLDGFPSA